MSISRRIIKAIFCTSLLLIFINLANGQTLPTDHFRSRRSGLWNSTSTWESSHDSISNWTTSNLAPSLQSSSVTIQSGHKVTIWNNLTIDQLIISQGATLKDSLVASLSLNNNFGTDLVVNGKIEVRNPILGQGSVRIGNFGEYSVIANNTSATVKSCQWDDGSTLRICNVNALSSITGLSQNLFNFIWDGGATQQNAINLNLSNSFHVRGHATVLNTNGRNLILSSSSSPTHYIIEGNLDILNKSYVVLSSSTSTGSVELSINGNLLIGQNDNLPSRLEMGIDGITNNVLNLSGNLTIGLSSGINRYSQDRNGKIIFNNTLVPQSIFWHPLSIVKELNFVINPEVSVTANSWTVSNGYSLIIKDNASLIIENNTVSASVERSLSNADWSIPYDGWHLLSSPVTNQALATGGFTTAPYDFYQWSEVQNQWLNQKVSANNITSFISGQGYLASYDNGGTLTFTGTLNTSPITFNNLSVSQTSPYAGFHLLGNPFPCSLDWNAVDWGRTNICGVAQVWDENARNYLPLTADNGIIPPTQGFFIQASSLSNSITIPNSARVHSNQPFYKDIPANLLRLRLTSITDSTFDETVIRFTEDASNVFDLSDGHKLAGSENSPQLYSVLPSGENMCVNSFSTHDRPETVPVYLEPGDENAYVLEARINTMSDDVYLEDKKNGSIILLKEGTSINIHTSTEDAISRFVLHFGIVGISEGKTAGTDVYSHGKSIYFRECSGKTYQITDITGRVVASGVINNSQLQQSNVTFLKVGVYIVTVTGAHNTSSVYKIILQ